MTTQLKNNILERLNELADSRNIQLFLFISFFVLLQFEYVNFIDIPLFREKNGFAFEFSLPRFIFVQLFFGFTLYIIYRMKNFDYFVNSLFFIFLSVPTIILYEFMPNTPIYISLFIILFHLLYYLSTYIKVNLSKIKFQVNNTHSLWYLLVIGFVFLLPFILDFGFIIRFDAFSLSPEGMYKVREIGTDKLTTLTAYLYGWLVRIIIPVIFIMALSKRKWFIVFATIIVQLYLYSLLAQKLVFITLFLTLIMYIHSHFRQITWVLFSLIGIVLVSIFISLITNNIMTESIIVRRTFFIPAIITKNYFEFFEGQAIYYSNSFLRNVFDYPFDLAPNLLIGQEFFPGSIKSANSGFISDGFMNLGYFGVFLNIIGVTVVFRLFSLFNVSKIYNGVFIIIIYTLVNGYFLTSMLTHGIIIMLIISFFMLRNSQQQTI